MCGVSGKPVSSAFSIERFLGWTLWGFLSHNVRYLSHVGICSQMCCLWAVFVSLSQVRSSLSYLRACVHDMRSLSCCGSLSQLWGLSAVCGRIGTEFEVSMLFGDLFPWVSDVWNLSGYEYKGKFHKWFWDLSPGCDISESFGGLHLVCEDAIWGHEPRMCDLRDIWSLYHRVSSP